jgi:predicted phage baseplate assembly protein
MPLTAPVLDDRTYADLRAELVRQIPVFAPEWTNHNESDPGIVLVDLLAFLGESLLYRFNQIPEATRIAFLNLLGLQRSPATPAAALVATGTARAEGVQVLQHTELRAGSLSFETDAEVYAWPLSALAAGKFRVPPVDTGPAGPGGQPDSRARAELDRRRDAARRLGLDPAAVQFYETRWLPGDPALAQSSDPTWLPPNPPTDDLVIDVGNTVDRALWIALLRRDSTDLNLLGGRTIFIGVAMDERIDPPFAVDGLDAAETERYRSADLGADPPGVLWRLWLRPAEPGESDDDIFTTLRVLRDSTRGLTTSGVVQLELPPHLDVPPETPGTGPTPPALDDPQQAAAVIAWLQVKRPQGESSGIHGLRWVGVNAVQAVQARTAPPELLGVGTGDAGQLYRLAHDTVLPRTVRLDVEETAGWQPWTAVDDFAASRPPDRHFVVDMTAGQVQFGTYCRVPQIGQRIRVRTYRYGGGQAGNVPAGTIRAITGVAGVAVSNPLPAQGGADAETVTGAADRIPAEVHRHDRAVTAEDFATLALSVPDVKRAEALGQFFPEVPTRPAAGVVSVMIFPGEDASAPDAPSPDRALLRRVAGYLDTRRLITTELYVIPPDYRKIAVAAGVVVRDGYQVDAVRRWVELILRQFLAPLPPFGPDGQGWPLGRTVRRAELEAVAVQVEGVEFLEGLTLGVPAGQGWQAVSRVDLPRWQVPRLTEITVVSGEPLPPGAAYPAAPDGVAPGITTAPLPREIC